MAIHPSAWNRNSRNFACRGFPEVEGIRCGWLEDTGRPCGEPAAYLAAGSALVASDTPVEAGGDVKSGPQWLCQEHLELALVSPPEDQPVFGHITDK